MFFCHCLNSICCCFFQSGVFDPFSLGPSLLNRPFSAGVMNFLSAKKLGISGASINRKKVWLSLEYVLFDVRLCIMGSGGSDPLVLRFTSSSSTCASCPTVAVYSVQETRYQFRRILVCSLCSPMNRLVSAATRVRANAARKVARKAPI